MELQEYISNKKIIQKLVLDLINDDENTEECFQNLINCIDDQKIATNDNEFRSLMHLIHCITQQHNRSTNFIGKIERILLAFKKEMHKFISNFELFFIFKANKRILLSMIENRLLMIDDEIISLIKENDDYLSYFNKEINLFFNKNSHNQEEKTDMNKFDENRRNGENENMFYHLIRKDLISEFIIYINKQSVPLNSKIDHSIFETNSFLIGKKPSLIEYAAFYGSIQIFTYLYKNKVKIKSSLWMYAIHGNNAEIFYLLEKEKLHVNKKEFFRKCLEEAISCHHNGMVEYIRDNYLQDQIDINEFINIKSIQYYNYEFIQINFLNRNSFIQLCSNDYYFIVNHLLKSHYNDMPINVKRQEKFGDLTFIINAWQIALINNYLNVFELLYNAIQIDINQTLICCNWPIQESEYHILYYLICNCDITSLKTMLQYKDIDVNIRQIEKTYNENSVEIIDFPLLYFAIENELINIVELLLSHSKINVNSDILYYKLIDHELVNQIREKSLLFYAIEFGNEEILRLLLQHPNIDVNKIFLDQVDDISQECTPLYHALKEKNRSIFKILLSHHNIDVNLTYHYIENNQFLKRNIIHEVVLENEIEILKDLLSHSRIDVNVLNIEENFKKIDRYEMSVLYIAVENNRKDIVKLLLSCQEIDVNYKSFFENESKKKFMPILHKAIINRDLDIVKNLLMHPKIDVNAKSFSKKVDKSIIKEKEQTALQCAIINGNVEIIQLLLMHPNIDFNAKSQKSLINAKNFFIEERTALQTAIIKNRSKVFRFIIGYLKQNNRFSNEFLKDLINITDDEYMKSCIYSLL